VRGSRTGETDPPTQRAKPVWDETPAGAPGGRAPGLGPAGVRIPGPDGRRRPAFLASGSPASGRRSHPQLHAGAG